MYGDKDTLVEAGDCVHQRPGIVHYLFDYSPDMEYLEIVGPADFKSSTCRRRARCRSRRPGRLTAWRRQKSMSSSSMSSGSSLAAAIHSFISGIAMIVWQ